MMTISTTKPTPSYRTPDLEELSKLESNPEIELLEGSQYKVPERTTFLDIPVPSEPKSLQRSDYSHEIARDYLPTLIISEIPISDIELNPANHSEVNVEPALETISQGLKLLRPEESAVDSEADEVEIDYSEMELRARAKKTPVGVNWKSAFSKAKTYSDVFNFQYDLDSEE